jgi:CubicO group peptidase (beta-lactamase class C family)
MKRMIHWIPAAIFAALATAQAASLEDPALVEAYVDGIVMSLMKDHSSPSGTVAIVKDGELILAKGYGYEDIEEQVPVDPYRTLFRPGSASKLFTWVAVMQLVEQGKLALDADVNEYLNSFRIKDTFEEPITLWHILTHTPGFEDGALGYLIIEDPDKALPLKEAMARYQPERVNPPGVQTAYSNYATALAGLIVSNVSGMEFNDYIEQNIFKPLGMNNSSFAEPLPERLAERMATSYGMEAGGFIEKPFEIISSFAPAGALSSTSADMVKFGQAILNGGELNGNRILREETVDQMLRPQFTHDDRLMGMGLGFYATDYNGYRVMGHGGDTQWFHSYLGIDRENDLTFFVSFGGSGGSPVRTLLAPAFYDQFFPRDEPPPEPPEDFKERAAKYAGVYGFWRSNFSTVEKAFSIGSGVTVGPTEDNTLVFVFGDKAKQYAEIEKNLFREISPNVSLLSTFIPRLIAFQENEAGQITGFVIDGLPFMSLRKLPVYATPNFNFTLVGFSMLVFLGVLLRRFYQRGAIKALPAPDRSVVNAAVYASAANWLTLLSGVAVVSMAMDQIIGGLPMLFKVWLVMPIIATLAGLYLLYRAILVWHKGLLAGAWARLRYTIVALSALFMCWFYYFWNILGWQYMQ